MMQKKNKRQNWHVVGTIKTSFESNDVCMIKIFTKKNNIYDKLFDVVIGGVSMYDAVSIEFYIYIAYQVFIIHSLIE